MPQYLSQIAYDSPNQAFWDHGAGAVCWNVKGKILILLTPCKECPHGYEVSHIHCNHKPGNWAAPGSKSGWNGNLETPSLRPSIRVPNRHSPEPVDSWHGFLVNGILTTEAPEDWSIYGF